MSHLPNDRHKDSLDRQLRHSPPPPPTPLDEALRRRILDALPDEPAPARRPVRLYLAAAAVVLIALALSLTLHLHQPATPAREAPEPALWANTPLNWNTLAMPLSREPLPSALADWLVIPLDAQTENLMADSLAALKFIGRCANVDTDPTNDA